MFYYTVQGLKLFKNVILICKNLFEIVKHLGGTKYGGWYDNYFIGKIDSIRAEFLLLELNIQFLL